MSIGQRHGTRIFMAGIGIALGLLLPLEGVGQKGAETTPRETATNPVVTLSLEDAVLQSLQNNEAFLLQKHLPVISGAFEQIERGEYDPSLFAEATHETRNTTELSRSTGNQFDVTMNQTDGVLGVVQRTPLGTEITASVASGRNESDRTPVQYASRLGIRVTQQLLRGAGPSVNLASIHRAELESRISQYELKGYAQMVVAEVEVTYWQYVRAVQSIAVVEKSLEVAMAKSRDIEEGIAVGAVPKNDAAAASAEVGLRQQRLIDAQSERDGLKLLLLQLVIPQIKQPYDATLVVDKPKYKKNSAVLFEDVPVKKRVALAMKSRAEISEAQMRLSQGKLETTVTRNGVLPKLELFIDLGKTGYASSFSTSFSELGSATYDAAVGLRFSHALGNRAANAQKEKAVATTAMQKQAIRNLQNVITYEVYQANNELQRAKQQLTTTAQTHGHSEKALKSVQARFEVGASTALEVVQAERDLLENEIAAVNAKVDYQIAKVRLYQAEGSLTQRRGIVLE